MSLFGPEVVKDTFIKVEPRENVVLIRGFEGKNDTHEDATHWFSDNRKEFETMDHSKYDYYEILICFADKHISTTCLFSN